MCSKEKGWILNLDCDPPTHPLTCFPLGFHWYSTRANLSTDWFLQTDAEGDTNSLINWPSRYTQAGCVSPQYHLSCCHSAGLTKALQPLWAVFLELSEHNPVPFFSHRIWLNLIYCPGWCSRTSALSVCCRHHGHPHYFKLPFPWLDLTFTFCCVQFNHWVKTNVWRSILCKTY